MKPNQRSGTHVQLFPAFLLAIGLALSLTGCPDGGEEDREPFCGDDICNERSSACPADCRSDVDAAVSTSTCNNRICEPGEATSCPADCAPPPPPPPPAASLVVRNNSSQVVYRLFIRQCGTSAWGSDQLGTRVIPVSSSFEVTAIPPGCYFFRAETSGTTYWQSTTSVTLYAAQAYTWTLVN